MIVKNGAGLTREIRDMYTRTAADVLRDAISRETEFDSGEPFESEAEVRAYFTSANLRDMFDLDDDVPDDATLDAWADIVISNRWHCDF